MNPRKDPGGIFKKIMWPVCSKSFFQSLACSFVCSKSLLWPWSFPAAFSERVFDSSPSETGADYATGTVLIWMR